MTKADYVLSQPQTRQHHCHWPHCNRQVPPAMWGCRPHWFMLPMSLRSLIWKTYEPGQEIKGTPTKAYIDAATQVQAWIAEAVRMKCEICLANPAVKSTVILRRANPVGEMPARWRCQNHPL